MMMMMIIMMMIIIIIIIKQKGKFHPRTDHESPDGSRSIALIFL